VQLPLPVAGVALEAFEAKRLLLASASSSHIPPKAAAIMKSLVIFGVLLKEKMQEASIFDAPFGSNRPYHSNQLFGCWMSRIF